jgi:hypothetical protein
VSGATRGAVAAATDGAVVRDVHGPAAMNITVRDAVRARRLLRFVYEGYERVVGPHAYGVNTAGHEA